MTSEGAAPAASPSDESVLSVAHVTKAFGGVTALRDIGFELRGGEIYAISGENGAGKSTLIKVLSGVHPSGSYDGEVRVRGVRAELTVAENIYLGAE